MDYITEVNTDVVDVVRKEFGTGFRKGSRKDTEFKSGAEFEQYMFGFYSPIGGKENYLALVSETPKPLRPHLFFEAILWSIQNKKDYDGLVEINPPCFALFLFREVQQRLSSKDKSLLQMYAVVGTPFDYDFGVDLVFMLDDAVVTIDVTINPTSKNNDTRESHHFIFSHFQLSQRATAQFAKNIADALRTPGHHKHLALATKQKIEEALHTRSTVI